MKFPRNARIFRGQLDAAPVASVFFLLVIFVMLGTMVYTPGVRVPIELPSSPDANAANALPGTDRPTVSIALDAEGQFYLENQRVSETALTNRLQQLAKKSPQPLTLIVQADKHVTEEMLVHLAQLCRGAGIQELLLATLPRAFSSDAPKSPASP
jgi:biopolymer transport protein TolR